LTGTSNMPVARILRPQIRLLVAMLHMAKSASTLCGLSCVFLPLGSRWDAEGPNGVRSRRPREQGVTQAMFSGLVRSGDEPRMTFFETKPTPGARRRKLGSPRERLCGAQCETSMTKTSCHSVHRQVFETNPSPPGAHPEISKTNPSQRLTSVPNVPIDRALRIRIWLLIAMLRVATSASTLRVLSCVFLPLRNRRDAERPKRVRPRRAWEQGVTQPVISQLVRSGHEPHVVFFETNPNACGRHREVSKRLGRSAWVAWPMRVAVS
jgi:hypothetical protein